MGSMIHVGASVHSINLPSAVDSSPMNLKIRSNCECECELVRRECSGQAFGEHAFDLSISLGDQIDSTALRLHRGVVVRRHSEGSAHFLYTCARGMTGFGVKMSSKSLTASAKKKLKSYNDNFKALYGARPNKDKLSAFVSNRMPNKSIKATRNACKLPLVEIADNNQALTKVVEADNTALLRCSPRKGASSYASPKKQLINKVDLFKSPLAKCAGNAAAGGGSGKKVALVSFTAKRSFAATPQRYVSPVKGARTSVRTLVHVVFRSSRVVQLA
ncbi:unnamed protein product [Sphagnum balticum]